MKGFVTFLIAVSLFLPACAAEAETVRYDSSDVERYNRAVSEAVGSDCSNARRIVDIALGFLGTPYVSGSIELEPEMLTVKLNETDCILFVESVLALALVSGSQDTSFTHFTDILRSLRYRDGIVDGYASRLHYTSDWIIQAQSNGYLHEITGAIGGRKFDQKFQFMSTHPDSYEALKEHPDQIARIKEAEERLNGYDYFKIDKENISECEDLIEDGDIVCLCSSVQGLDIAHIGIAYHRDGHLSFIHASSSAGKVIVNDSPLSEYTAGIKSQSGLRVLRVDDNFHN